MSDVARLAGVSHQTVSRVINDSTHVRPETRERVRQAMRELGYRPNAAARALVTGRSKIVGVISFDTTLHGPASTLFGIERAAHEAGCFTIVASLQALDSRAVEEAIDRLARQGVDGLVLIAPHGEAAAGLLHAPPGVPVVAVEAGPKGAPTVSIDQFSGAASATRHLLDLGHETVWHIAGPADWHEARQRLAGWRAALDAAGVAPPPPFVGDWSARAGYDLGRRLSGDPGVTAIFVANDQMALGVLRAMHEAGRQIPAEISVVGFDDVPEAPYFTPPLTTIRQDFNEMGSRGLRLLLRMIEMGGPVSPGPPIRPQLIVRASTAVPRVDRRAV